MESADTFLQDDFFLGRVEPGDLSLAETHHAHLQSRLHVEREVRRAKRLLLTLAAKRGTSRNEYVWGEDRFGPYFGIILHPYGYLIKVDRAFETVVRAYKWYPGRTGGGHRRMYACARLGRQSKQWVKLHQLVFGARPGERLDHANGDSFDNRLGNLRPACQMHNMWNRRAKKRARSKYKGIEYDRGMWRARIMCKGKRYRGASFRARMEDGVDVGELDAARAYDKLAREHHGVWAYLNFPGEGDETMSYRMAPEEREEAQGLRGRFGERKLAAIGAELADCTVEEVALLCRECECNVQRLPSEILQRMPPKGRGYSEVVPVKGVRNGQAD